MPDGDHLVLRVEGPDEEELARDTATLRADLWDLDVRAVDPVAAPEPSQAKGVGAVAGWLVVQLGTLERLRAVLDAVRQWAGRTSRTVEVSLGGDVLKVSGLSPDQQEEIIDAWLARHAAGT